MTSANQPATTRPVTRPESIKVPSLQMGGKDKEALEDALRTLAARVEAIEAVASNSGIGPRIGTSGETYLWEKALVHIRPDGVVLFARNDNEELFCNGVVTAIRGKRVEVYSIGEWPVRLEPVADGLSEAVYLSDVPGYGTVTPPTEVGAVLQRIGFKTTARDTEGGWARVALAIGSAEVIPEPPEPEPPVNDDGTATAGETIAEGDLLCVDAANATAWLARADVPWRYCTHMAAEAGGAGDTITLRRGGMADMNFDGPIDYGKFNVAYVSETPGKATQSPPAFADNPHGVRQQVAIIHGSGEDNVVPVTIAIEEAVIY